MVGATPPTLHALPREGVRKDTKGEHPDGGTGNAVSTTMMKPKDEDFLRRRCDINHHAKIDQKTRRRKRIFKY
jgi:hypothetical protein